MSHTAEQQNSNIHFALPPLNITDGMVESLKWLALTAMTLDHTNKIIFNSEMPFMTEIGRIAMPLFGFILAYNLARPEILAREVHFRTMQRMLFFGLLAMPVYVLTLAHASWIHLNIMFTLILATGIIYLNDKGGFYRELLAITLFIIGGFFVEYLWFGLAYCLAAWYYCKQPNLKWLLLWLSATVSLYVMNESHWALLAIPIIFLGAKLNFKLPRLRLAFYLYYPLHLAVLWGIVRYS